MWEIAVDTGGTFTDCLAFNNRHPVKRLKLLSTGEIRAQVHSISNNTIQIDANWISNNYNLNGFYCSAIGNAETKKIITQSKSHILELDSEVDAAWIGTTIRIFTKEEAPIVAARLLTGTNAIDNLPELRLKLGTTRATNALLERKGIKPLLICSKGFADLLTIGTQQRPDLFALEIQKSTPLHEQVIEADECVAANGTIIHSLTEPHINVILRQVFATKPQTVVISLKNSYVNPIHEQTLKRLLVTAGVKHVVCSHELEASIKYLERTQTAVVNGYLLPVMSSYLANITQVLGNSNRLEVMTSSGGLTGGSFIQPKDCLLSGPAGGVVGCAKLGTKLGIPKLLAFDMGGTSTDVSRYAGKYDYEYLTRIEDAEIMSPTLAIETVAAGGGSICYYDGYALRVGPESAGAHPGPACYNAGGPLTLTDVNLLLGRLTPGSFSIPVNVEAALQALKNLISKSPELQTMSEEEILLGFLQIANEKMAKTMEKVSLSKGYDAKEHSLVAFGGAGGMHACAIAHRLNINQILLPYDAGILSASGIASTPKERILSKQILKPLDNFISDIQNHFSLFKEQAAEQLMKDGVAAESISLKGQWLLLRFKGQDNAIEVAYPSTTSINKEFKKNYLQRFGHYLEDIAIEVESIKVEIAEDTEEQPTLTHPKEKRVLQSTEKIKSPVTALSNIEYPVFRIKELKEGDVLQGPAVILNPTSTAFIEKGWTGIVNKEQDILVRLEEIHTEQADKKSKALELTLYTNRFAAIVNDMGSLLQRTAFSVNIKERLDFSCALLDANGQLVVNAPHIPVHLGALGMCVRKVMQEVKFEEGDIIVTNHPAYGGSHLPDITLISPCFYKGKLIGFLANRAHHAELGGISPGSMPANATSLEEEGVVITPFKIYSAGNTQIETFKKFLMDAKWPSRNPEINLADIRASIASILFGRAQLVELCERYSTERITSYMQHILSYSNQLLANALNAFPQKKVAATEYLDNGTPLSVSIEPASSKWRIDFTGTGSVSRGNMNATPAIVNSAVLYVLRLLIKENIPLNEGLLFNIEIALPECLLNPPFTDNPAECPAVVGGNVEISQRLVDTLLKAFGIAACSQGTMNNFLFGNENFGFYETLCGGVGATPTSNGAHAVHQHMTNTRITDAEVMEYRFPVRVEEFSIRKNSGGTGDYSGGNGVVRRIRFLEDVEVTLLAQHRNEAPYGLNGAESGAIGRQFLIHSEGDRKEVSGTVSCRIKAHEAFEIYTPGGGGANKARQ